MTFLPWVAYYSKLPLPVLNHPLWYFSAWEMVPLLMSHWSLFSDPWNLPPLEMIFSARKKLLWTDNVLINSQCRKQWSYWRKLRTCLFGDKIFWNMMIWFHVPPDLTILHKRHVTSAQHFALSFTHETLWVCNEYSTALLKLKRNMKWLSGLFEELSS